MLNIISLSAGHFLGFVKPSAGLDVLRMKPIVSIDSASYASLAEARSIASLF